LTPSKAALLETTLLKASAGAAGAQVVSTEFFFQQLIAVHDSHPAFHLSLGGKSTTTLAHRLKKMAVRLCVHDFDVA